MPSLRVLTVDLADLNLETDVINGAKVEISIERTTTFDSFVIAPSLDYKATSDETGILTFNILPSDANTVYRASVIDASGKQVLSSVFVMPDSDANLAELLELSYFPDGLNVGQNTEASFIQFKSNGANLGTPQTVRNFNMAQDGLLTFDLESFTVTLDLASINTAIAGKEPSIASGTSLQFWRGDKTWQTLDTSVVPSTTDKRYVTDAQLSVIGSTSGTNTGDETATTIRTKIGAASASNDGYLAHGDWSKIPSSYVYSAGLITITNLDGSTASISIANTSASELMTNGMTLTAGKSYVVPASGGAITVNLPSSPTSGDFVWIEDCYPETGVTRFNGTAVNLSAGSNWVGLTSIYHSINLVDPTNAVGAKTPDFRLLYRFNSVSSTWDLTVCRARNNLYASAPYLRLYNQYTPYYVTMVIPDATLTGNRSIILGDSDVDLRRNNTLPQANTSAGNDTGGTASAILAGGVNKTTKTNQAVLVGQSVNADSAMPEDAWFYGNRATAYSGAKVTGGGGILKAQSTGTASASLVTGSNTKPPAYLTKPTGHHAVSIYELAITHTSSAGAVWFGRRRVCVRWDGATATLDTQTTGTDWNPDTQTVTLTPSVSSGLLTLDMANTTAGGGDTCYWQCTYTSHYNGG